MSPTDRERRRHKRVTLTIRAPLAVDSGSGVLLENSSTIDLSESGVRLRLRGQIVLRQFADVFLNKRPERCRVVWASSAGVSNELIAGLQFIRPLPEP
jgi:PilZ domain